MSIRPRLIVVGLLAFVALVSIASASADQPTFVTNTIDDTFQLGQTSAVCGFPVFEHDFGTVTTMITTLPDGSLRRTMSSSRSRSRSSRPTRRTPAR